VLKTIGFSSRSVQAMVLAESVLLLLLGGVIGMALVSAIVPRIGAASGGMIPVHGVSAATWLAGLLLMLGIGIVVGWMPAWRAMRLNIVDALSGR
jgi:putative ABC transport system permease protein